MRATSTFPRLRARRTLRGRQVRPARLALIRPIHRRNSAAATRSCVRLRDFLYCVTLRAQTPPDAEFLFSPADGLMTPPGSPDKIARGQPDFHPMLDAGVKPYAFDVRTGPARTPAYAARGPIIVLYKMTCKQALCPIIMRYIGPLWLAMSDNMCCIMGLRALQVRSVMLTKEAAARPVYPYLPAAVEED